jgi:branched-chain amino acid transport system permease protein
MSIELLFQTILNGLFIGFLFGLAGMGLTLIFGIMKLVNFATGAMIILGGYVAYWVWVLSGVNPIIAAFVSIVAGLSIGLGLYFTLIRRVIRTPGLISLLALFGVAAITENAMLNLWSPNPRTIAVYFPSLNLGLVAISGNRAVVSVFAIAGCAALLAMLKWTYFGRTIRATVQDWRAATLMGIDVNRIYALGFAIGVALTLFAGGLLVLIYPIEPMGGLQYGLYAFCVVVLGTLGNPLGCLLAGLIIGLATSFTGSYWTVNMSPAVAYLILVLTFLLRPSGLMGGKA